MVASVLVGLQAGGELTQGERAIWVKSLMGHLPRWERLCASSATRDTKTSLEGLIRRGGEWKQHGDSKAAKQGDQAV